MHERAASSHEMRRSYLPSVSGTGMVGGDGVVQSGGGDGFLAPLRLVSITALMVPIAIYLTGRCCARVVKSRSAWRPIASHPDRARTASWS